MAPKVYTYKSAYGSASSKVQQAITNPSAPVDIPKPSSDVSRQTKYHVE